MIKNRATSTIRSRQHHVRPVAGLMLAFLVVSTKTHAEPPDPRALLRGVETTRLAIPSGRLELVIDHIDHARPKSGVHRQIVEVAFDGSKRRFDQREKVLIVDGRKPNASEASIRLKSLGGDRKAFVGEGLGISKDVHVRTAFDGSQLLQYCEDIGAIVRDPNKGTSDYAFDPRVMGITVWFTFDDDVEGDLGYRQSKTISLVGQEAINGHQAYHVLVADDTGRERHIWIDPNNFSVYKFSISSQFENNVSISEYDEGRVFRELPSRITLNNFDNTGKLYHETTFTVARAEVGPVDSKCWTLAGMGMPLGQMVSDQRIHRVIGFFDGQGLTPSMPEAVRKGKAARWAPLHWGMALSGLVALTVLGAWVIRRRNLLREGDA